MADLTSPDLQETYPWTTPPLITSAPMRLISTPPLATTVSLSHGLGFLGAGSDISTLSSDLTSARTLLSLPPTPSPTDHLPIGVGLLTWGAPLALTLPILTHHRPCAIWLFAPRDPSHASLRAWTTALRTPEYTPQIWIQVGSVAEAVSAFANCAPDVLVVQGSDAGGHGLAKGASIVSLVPEVRDALVAHLASAEAREGSTLPTLIAAGGIADGRGVAAAMALGADGVCMGTRYLAASEAVLAGGYREEVLRVGDGGQTTVRSKVYDTLRGTRDWPERYGGRGVINASYEDWIGGMDEAENTKLYEEAVKAGDVGWGVNGRMTTYAGTAVGLVRKVQSAKEITEEVREEYRNTITRLARRI